MYLVGTSLNFSKTELKKKEVYYYHLLPLLKESAKQN